MTFKRKATSPISWAALLRQAPELDIVHLPHVIGLGGKEYRAKLQEVFHKIEFPFAGLGLYEMVTQAKRCKTSVIPAESFFAIGPIVCASELI